MESYVEATRHAVAAGAAGLRVVGELPPGTDDHPHTWPGWSRYEAVVNEVLMALPFKALCAYDARHTDDSLLAAVRETHTHTWRDGVRAGQPRLPRPGGLPEPLVRPARAVGWSASAPCWRSPASATAAAVRAARGGWATC